MVKKKRNKAPFIVRATQWTFPRLERFAPFLARLIFKLAFYIPAKYPVPDKEKEIEKKAARSFLEIEGKKIQIYSWGDPTRPYVLLVHGWAGRATQFRKFIQPLEDAGFRVVGFDAPAHGRSQGVKTSILEFENALKKIYLQFGPPVGLITHSFGGGAALYAASKGLKVSKLINIAAPYVADEILKSYLSVLAGSWESAESFKKFVLSESGKPFEEFTGLYLVQHLPHPIQLFVVHDEDDKEMLVLHAEELIKVYPSAKFLRTKGLGHSRILKDEAVIGECLKFIASSFKI
ncbi:alpha/beta hydrolase [soil metagenome]